MLFNSIDFLLFFPIAVVIYYILPKKARYLWLLVCSYYFYMGWNQKYALLLLACTGITYLGGILIENISKRVGGGTKLRTLVLLAGIILNLGLLGYFKYYNFLISMVNKALGSLRLGVSFPALDIILPVGISFYIFQALGYLIDVYRGDIYAEKNFFRYALFVSFFPQLVAGPIERSKNLLTQLAEPAGFSYENLRKGLLLMLWGFFLKLVIADRAGIIVNTVYGNDAYTGFYIVVETLLFSIQIYCDFNGYSTIARGAALVMGIRLTDNFQAPYFSKSVKEFWRRWHISLSGWFRDYLYIPLGGSRKGWLRKEINLLIVFCVSGLWHGASVSFIVWGLLNGVYQVVGDILGKIRGKYLQGRGNPSVSVEKHRSGLFRDLGKWIGCFGLISFAWLFFRAGGMMTAFRMLGNILVFNWTVLFDGSLYGLGVEKAGFMVLLLAIFVLFMVDAHKYRGEDVAELLLKQKWLLRVAAEMTLLFTVILFGQYGELYGASEFIYFQF